MKSLGFGRFAVVLFLALLSTWLLSAVHARPKPEAFGYHLVKTISLPPAPGGGEYYDYITVDPEARRVYVSHGTEVVVLNADNYSVVGKVEGLTRSHGIAVVKELGKGFITDGDSRPGAEVQQVVIFDLKTFKVTGKVSTDSTVLESLRDAHPVIGKILEYRQVTKLKSTYIDALPVLVDADGRVHTSFNQTVAATGHHLKAGLIEQCFHGFGLGTHQGSSRGSVIDHGVA